MPETHATLGVPDTGVPTTLLSELMELMDACIEQGKAVARGDRQSAGDEFGRSLLALDRVLSRAAPEELPAAIRQRIAR